MLIEEVPRVQQDFRGMLDWDFQGTALLGCKKQMLKKTELQDFITFLN